ncbi:MAG: hypothetical protein IAF02_12750 [Anaerolineae bacterium]|nr:hypothetical protein [Anaerolineae bacterium]
MKTRKQYLLAGIAIGAIMVVVFLGIGAAVSAFPSGRLAGLIVPAASTAVPPLDEVIPLESVSDLTSLNATVKISVNGLIDGERAQGELTGLLAVDEQGKSQITVSGSLLGDLAAQVGGSVVGLFTPSKVDLYKVPEGAYVVLGGLFPMCIKPEALNATDTLDEMSPLSMLSMLTSSEVARGKLVGEEKLNGVAVKHYVINGDAFLAAAQASSDPQLQAFGQALWSADDADLYVNEDGYPVLFSGSYSGEYAPLKFEGNFTVEIALTGVNTNPSVKLPSSCKKPVSG